MTPKQENHQANQRFFGEGGVRRSNWVNTLKKNSVALGLSRLHSSPSRKARRTLARLSPTGRGGGGQAATAEQRLHANPDQIPGAGMPGRPNSQASAQ